MSQQTEEQRRRLSLRLLLLLGAWSLPVAPVTGYVNSMVLGVSGAEAMNAVAVLTPGLFVVLGVLYPYLLFSALVGRALAALPGDRPGDRLQRLLKLPWRCAVYVCYGGWTLGGLGLALGVCLWFDKSLYRAVGGGVLGLCVGLTMAFPFGLGAERLLLPLVLEEQRRHPTLAPVGYGLFWPRQSWYLPWTFIASILSTLFMGSCVVVMKLLGLRDMLSQELLAENALRSLARLQDASGAFLSELGFALAWVLGLVLLIPTATTWMMARRQAQSARAVREAIESLANGRLRAPQWVSTDEMGDLSAGMNAVLARLSNLPLSLQSSASRLVEASDNLTEANALQRESLNRQAAALHETQVTSEEIKQVSLLAAQRAETVLQMAARAEQLGQTGETAIEQSMAGLAFIQSVVDSLCQSLMRLGESTRQVGSIAQTVKDLADRSNMLALNAAIEAVRSGEHGKGFGVVAREIRVLADRSIKATQNIHSLLDEVGTALRDAATLGERGSQQVSEGLTKLRSSSESLRELSRITQEHSSAMRQIAAAINQQNSGVTQIFTAIADLSQIMNATLQRLESTQQAAAMLQNVSGEVKEVARQFEVN